MDNPLLLHSSSVLSFSSLSFLALYFVVVWTTGRSISRRVDRITFSCSNIEVHAPAPYNIDGVMTATNRRNLWRNKQHLDVNSCRCLAKDDQAIKNLFNISSILRCFFSPFGCRISTKMLSSCTYLRLFSYWLERKCASCLGDFSVSLFRYTF